MEYDCSKPTLTERSFYRILNVLCCSPWPSLFAAQFLICDLK